MRDQKKNDAGRTLQHTPEALRAHALAARLLHLWEANYRLMSDAVQSSGSAAPDSAPKGPWSQRDGHD